MRKAGVSVVLGVSLAVLVALGGLSIVLRPHLVSLYRSAFPEKVEFGRGVIVLGGHRVEVEIASTEAARDRGLMYRSKLPPNTGMLFVFDTAEQQCMWMKNTRVALSVAFIDAGGTVLNIEEMKPLTEDIHCSKPGAAARYAVEMPARWFVDSGLSAGTRVGTLPGMDN